MASMVSRPFSPSLSTTPSVLPEPMISESASRTVRLPSMRGRSFGVAVGRLELHVADLDEREPLEDPVGADERGDELGVRVSEDGLGGVVLGEDAALLEDGDLVPQLYGLVYVVGNEDDGLLYVSPESARTRPEAARA